MKWYSILAFLTKSIIWIVVCILVSRYNRLCFGTRRRAVQLAGGAGAEGGTRGLEAAEIERYPKLSYPKVEDHQGVKMSRDITECVVCLGEFTQGESLRLIPKCGHVFHADCIDIWLRSHATCPYCRANLLLPPAKSISELPV